MFHRFTSLTVREPETSTLYHKYAIVATNMSHKHETIGLVNLDARQRSGYRIPGSRISVGALRRHVFAGERLPVETWPSLGSGVVLPPVLEHETLEILQPPMEAVLHTQEGRHVRPHDLLPQSQEVATVLLFKAQHSAQTDRAVMITRNPESQRYDVDDFYYHGEGEPAADTRLPQPTDVINIKRMPLPSFTEAVDFSEGLVIKVDQDYGGRVLDTVFVVSALRSHNGKFHIDTPYSHPELRDVYQLLRLRRHFRAAPKHSELGSLGFGEN